MLLRSQEDKSTFRFRLAALVSGYTSDRRKAANNEQPTRQLRMKRHQEYGGLFPIFAALSFLMLLGLHMWSLMRTPPVFVDEAFTASLAWGLVHDGIPYGPLQGEVFKQYPGYWALFSWSSTWLYSLPIRLVGLDLFALRLVSLVFGIILLLAVYTIGSQLFNRVTGLAAVLLTGLSIPFFNSGHQARPDIMVAAVGFSAIALQISDSSPNLSLRSLLSGLLIGLAFEMHPANGMLFGPVLLSLFFLDLRWRMLKHPRFWGFALGATVMLVIYAALHVLPFPKTYGSLIALAFGTAKTPPILNIQLLPASLIETTLLLVVSNDLLTPILIASVIMMWKRKALADFKLLVMSAVFLIQFIAILAYKPLLYSILVVPATSLMVANLLFQESRVWKIRSVNRAIRNVSILSLLIASVIHSTSPALKNAHDDYQLAVARVREVAPRNSSLLGEGKYWFGLSDYQVVPWLELIYYQRYYQDYDLEKALLHYNLDFFIVDSGMESHIVDSDQDLNPGYRFGFLPREDVDSLLREQSKLVLEIQTGTFGKINVFRLR